MATAALPSTATQAFSLQGPAGGDYAYNLKPGGADYFRTSGGATVPITNKQYTSARFLAGNSAPTSDEIEAQGAQIKPTAAAGPATGGSGTDTSGDTNDVSQNQALLASADAQNVQGKAAVDAALGKLVSGTYDPDTAANEGQYSDQTNQNRQAFETNKQTSLVNAAQGRQGLFGTLAGLGALNGSGIELANNAVAKGANTDIAGANTTYATNQNNLDTAIGAFRRQDQARRAQAQQAAQDAKTSIDNATAKAKQTAYAQISKDYSAMGDATNAAKYAQLASSLFPTLASTSVPDLSSLNPVAAAFNPGSLQSYLAGGGNTAVTTTAPSAGQPAPGLFAGLVPGQKQQTA